MRAHGKRVRASPIQSGRSRRRARSTPIWNLANPLRRTRHRHHPMRGPPSRIQVRHRLLVLESSQVPPWTSEGILHRRCAWRCTPRLVFTPLGKETPGDTHGLRWSGCGRVEAPAGRPRVPTSDAHDPEEARPAQATASRCSSSAAANCSCSAERRTAMPRPRQPCPPGRGTAGPHRPYATSPSVRAVPTARRRAVHR